LKLERSCGSSRGELVEEALFVLSGVVGLLALGLLGVFGLLQQSLRQYGRLLRRVEALEAPSTPVGTGLTAGTTVPPFRLPDTVGRLAGPEDYRGRRVLLVHWDPQSEVCGEIARDLAEVQRDLEKRETELLLVSYRDVETNRRFAEQHGLSCRILHLDGSPPLEIFASLGTPAAYLVDEEGTIAREAARGPEELLRLARDGVSPRPELVAPI
jgi:peroxiredoxin